MFHVKLFYEAPKTDRKCVFYFFIDEDSLERFLSLQEKAMLFQLSNAEYSKKITFETSDRFEFYYTKKDKTV